MAKAVGKGDEPYSYSYSYSDSEESSYEFYSESWQRDEPALDKPRVVISDTAPAVIPSPAVGRNQAELVPTISTGTLPKTSSVEGAIGSHGRSESVGVGLGKRTESEIMKHRTQTIEVHSLDERMKEKSTIRIDEHAMAWLDLSRALECEINLEEPGKSPGLLNSEAESRLTKFGPNVLKPPKGRNEIVEYFKCYNNLLIGLLFIGALIGLIAYLIDRTQTINLYLAIVLAIVGIISASMAYYGGRSASKIMASFKNMIPQATTVRREGREKSLSADQLVVGDVIQMKGGDRVPADCRILECSEFKVDNSSITGEVEPQQCTVEMTNEQPLETHNLAFSGSLAVSGTATAMVIRTGQQSMIGVIARLATTTKTTKTPLARAISRFVRMLGGFVLILAIVFGIISGIILKSATKGLLNALGIVLSMPQGLPATVTSMLAVAAKRLAQRNVLVKTLDYVETLGSVSVIATDKTGTLTQNRMTASHFFYNKKISTALNKEREFETFDNNDVNFRALFDVMALNSRSVFDDTNVTEDRPSGSTRHKKNQAHGALAERKVIGDASEAALLRFCHAVQDVNRFRDANPKVYEVPFNSFNKWQLSIHARGKARLLTMKGAPDVVITRCATYMADGKQYKIDKAFMQLFNENYERLGAMGERVLGFASLTLPPEFNESFDKQYDLQAKNFPTKDLCFVGFAALIDPPRETVPGAIEKCHEAHVKVIMITGDHPLTAVAIGRKVGIVTHETKEELRKRGAPEEQAGCIVVTGVQVPELKDEQWAAVFKHPDIIFARMSPQHKLTVVEQLQKARYIVAVTGDGVNDSPALKRADIGIAMGIAGSDVAKEAAAVVLMDDDFSSIVVGIEEGRGIFDNLKKTIAYQVTHCPGELYPTLLLIVFNIPLGMGPAILLMIDILTELPPSIALAHEPAESDIMTRPPRDPSERLMSIKSLIYSYFEAGSVQLAGALTSYFVIFNHFGYPASSVWQTGATYFSEGSPDLITPDGVSHPWQEQVMVLRYVWCGWFLSVVIHQFFNVLTCKTRHVSLFVHGIRNMYLNFGMIAELLLAAFVIYTPFMQDLLSSETVPYWFWLIPIPFGVFQVIWVELAKAWGRKYPNGIYAKYIAW